MSPAPKSARSRVAIAAIGLFAMLPWPILGLVLTAEMRDSPDEWAILFGGITLIPLIVVEVIGLPHAGVLYLAGILGVWAAAALLPAFMPRKAPISRTGVLILVLLQSGFSLVQAIAGGFLLFAKDV